MTTVYATKGEAIRDLVRGKVLDVGFWGQAVKMKDPSWPHGIIASVAKEARGIDPQYDGSLSNELYKKGGAEDFTLSVEQYFDCIFAGDLIEHLSNPGMFLERCREHIAPNGKLVLTTPNAFSFFTIVEKLFKQEPTVNSDHTLYLNIPTARRLLEKNGWRMTNYGYIRTSKGKFVVSKKRFMLYITDRLISLWTPKFNETLVIVAEPV